MDTPEKSLLTASVTGMHPRHLILAVTAGKEKGKITELIAGLMSGGHLHILAGSDWVPGYGLAHALRRRMLQVAQVLEQSSLARAFTCYQLLDLLAEATLDSNPLLVLNFLHNFYDADIPYPVRFRVLKECCHNLQRLSLHKPVAVVVQQTPAEDYGRFFPFLADIADEILAPAMKLEEASQPGLF